MTQPATVVITWSPEPPPNRKRWEAEIRSALAPIAVADVELVQAGDAWRVQSSFTAPQTEQLISAVRDHLVAMGFPVHP